MFVIDARKFATATRIPSFVFFPAATGIDDAGYATLGQVFYFGGRVSAEFLEDCSAIHLQLCAGSSIATSGPPPHAGPRMRILARIAGRSCVRQFRNIHATRVRVGGGVTGIEYRCRGDARWPAAFQPPQRRRRRRPSRQAPLASIRQAQEQPSARREHCWARTATAT